MEEGRGKEREGTAEWGKKSKKWKEENEGGINKQINIL